MKAYPFTEDRLLKWQPPFIVQPKYDGDRCKAYFNTDAGYLLTSSEDNPFFSVPHINAELDSSGMVLTLDGELYDHDLCLKGGHELIHSIASRTQNLHPNHNQLKFYVFDIDMPGTQLERLSELTKISKLYKHIIVAPFWICESLDSIKNVYDKLINTGYEGIIIRNINNNYEYKRSTMMMKFKPKRSDDYLIVGYNEEVSKDGIPKGRLGSLMLSSQFGDTFCVSAGLDSEERSTLWNIKETLPGKIATVYYQHLTEKQIPKGCFNLEIKGELTNE
jgi:ATP-dependent DNA ligase